MKMKKADVKPFKEMLLVLRARLRGDVSTLADAALSNSGSGRVVRRQFRVIWPIWEATLLSRTTRSC